MSVIRCFFLFLPRDKLTLKTDAPDGIEQGCFVMKLKYTITLLATLVVSMLTTTASYAQILEALFGVAQGYLEKSIDNSNYSSQGKDDFKTIVNFLSDEVNANQKAKNATKDAYEGNYTGAIIQGVQTIMNATGNHQYDTYLNSANAVNKANREYNQNVSSGMDRQEALEKRNEVMGYSIAESVIELQDKIAQERIEKARQQREAERQARESNSYYTTPSYNSYNESTPKTSTSSFNQNSSANVPEASWQILREYGAGNKGSVNQSAKEDTSDGLEESWKILRGYATNIPSDPSSNVLENREHNNSAQVLTSNNFVKFLSDNGDLVCLYIVKKDNRSCFSYYNYSDQERKLSCNRVGIKVKYVGDNAEQSFQDACTIVMPPHTSKVLEWSDVFFSISDYQNIESIKVQFVGTQIK